MDFVSAPLSCLFRIVSYSIFTQNPTAMAADGKKIEKFGVQTAKGKRILVFRNGDKFHKVTRIPCNGLDLWFWLSALLNTCASVL